MNKEYSLFTINDIFKKVPTDRIRVCLDELAVLLITQRTVVDAIKVTSEAMGTPLSESPFSFDKPLIWKDDGKGELVVRYSSNGSKVVGDLMTTVVRMDTKAK